MGKKHKKACRVLNYNDHWLIVTSKITGFITILAFVFLVGISIRIIGDKIFKMCNNCRN